MSSLALLALFAAVGVQEPVASFRFPTEPIGPRSAALGGSGAAAPFDAEASANPAVVVGAHRASLHCFQGYAGYRGFVVAATAPLPGGVVVGVGARHFDYGDVIEDDLGAGAGELEVGEEAYRMSAAIPVGPRVSAGAAVSLLSATYFGSTTSATSFALGLVLAPGRGTRIGVAVREMGADARNQMARSRYRLPTRLRAGIAQRIGLARSELTVLADVELGVRGRGDPGMHMGLEWSLASILALRAGYSGVANPDLEGGRSDLWSGGVGVGIGSVELGAGARFGGSTLGTELFVGLDAFR